MPAVAVSFSCPHVHTSNSTGTGTAPQKTTAQTETATSIKKNPHFIIRNRRKASCHWPTRRNTAKHAAEKHEVTSEVSQRIALAQSWFSDRLAKSFRHSMTPKLFSELGLSPEIIKAIDKLGFEQAAPIQGAAIPVLLAGKDVVGQSQTGSGKTAAFAIPAIEKTDPNDRAVQVLILCPTRELAVQVAEEVHKLAIFKRGIQALPIYGGQSYDRQLYGLRQGAQIVIGTPGRVMDHMRRGTLRLDKLKMVILDEADVMLNMGFREDIEFILQSTPASRQTVFFSATMPRPIRELIEKYAKTPENVRIEQQAMTVPTVEQIYFEVDRRWKVDALIRLIDIHDLKLAIIFCNTKRMVDDLVEQLNTQGYSAEGLHGDLSQAQRDRVMNKFRKAGLEFLVATDVAARGIDVDDIQAVFNYDLPYDPEDYVHRIGRTGRAGRSGMAFSFVAGRELFQIRHIERFTNMRIQRGRVPSVEEVDEARANVLLNKVRATLQAGEFERQDHAVERLLEEGFDSTDVISALLHLLQGDESNASQPPAKTDAREHPQRPERTAPLHTASSAPVAPKQPLRATAKTVAPRPASAEPKSFKTAKTAAPIAAAPLIKSSVIPISISSGPSAPMSEPAISPLPRMVKVPLPKKSVRAALDSPGARQPVRRDYDEYEDQPRERPQHTKAEHGKSVPNLIPQRPASRRTPEQMTRLWLSVGDEHSVTSGDIVGCILGETGLPTQTVGTVDIRERHTFVDVAAESVNAIISKLKRTVIRGHRLKIKPA